MFHELGLLELQELLFLVSNFAILAITKLELSVFDNTFLSPFLCKWLLKIIRFMLRQFHEALLCALDHNIS